jgi:D-glycero-D-manno-heptose 1,7-bisphosphate phosphatase
VVTNQPGVARGLVRREQVERLDELMASYLPMIDTIYVYHDDNDCCHCRKPRPGLLLDAARDRDIDLGTSYIVGDRWRDIGAGQAAGVTAVFIDCGYSEEQSREPHAHVYSLPQAVAWILENAGARASTVHASSG